jgi:hypothetical protein
MVNTIILSRFTGPPQPDPKNRKILTGPLYPAEEVLELLTGISTDSVLAWTNKCIRDLQKWSLDSEDLIELLRIAVTSGRYRGSEWCVQHPHGPWAACDAYELIRNEHIEHLRKEMDIEYYLKFAISRTGLVMLVVSCHPPEDRN